MPKDFQRFRLNKNCLLLIFMERNFFNFLSLFLPPDTVAVAQLVRASDCGSEGRRFEPG